MEIAQKYLDAIEYLTQHPGEIHNAWYSTGTHIAGCLFRYAGPRWHCGCLTQIRACEAYSAATPELTQEIRQDERIPADVQSITVQDLPVFAEWQQKLDDLGIDRT